MNAGGHAAIYENCDRRAVTTKCTVEQDTLSSAHALRVMTRVSFRGTGRSNIWGDVLHSIL